ncbi:MAG: hypothetical protein WBG90_02280 [Saonia sp.]
MKLKFLIFMMVQCIFAAVHAQIKIGDNPQNINATSVLELESNSRVFVITRINTTQMNAIVPSQGAMVYNTDTQCIHYYNGIQWVNICESISNALTFTNNPIINNDSTITIIRNGNNYNFEVSRIRSENIVDFSIVSDDIGNNSINIDKLANASVGENELADVAVTTEKIKSEGNDQVLTTNAIGEVEWINKAALVGATVSTDLDNSIIPGTDGGAFYDDPDDDVTNEIQDLSISGNTLALTRGAGPVRLVNLPVVDGATLDISAQFNPLSISGNGTPLNLYEVADNAINSAKIEDGEVQTNDIADGNVTPVKIENGAANQVLRTNAAGTGVEWSALDANNIVGEDLTAGDGSITVNTGTGATLVDASILVTNGGITTAKLANGTAAGQLFQWDGTNWVLVDNSTVNTNLATEDITQDAGEDRTYNLNGQDLSFIGGGNVGIGTATPTSTLETGGSFATTIRNNVSGIVTLTNDDHTVVFSADGSVTLPAAGSFPGRLYIIKNPSFTVTIDSFIDTFGSNSTSIPAGVVWLQSDGTNWQQIN